MLDNVMISPAYVTGKPAISRVGRDSRKGIGFVEAAQKFGDHDSAVAWIERARWGGGSIVCPHCGSERGTRRNRKDSPYRCRDCRKDFSTKTGTSMAESKMPIEKWLIAAYQDLTNLKGVSSMKLSRDLQVGQQATWFMLHRIREAFMSDEPPAEFADGKEFQVDEAYIGGIEKYKHAKDKIPGGQGGSTKQIVIGITEKESGKIWVDVIPDTQRDTIADIVNSVVPEHGIVYTDDARHYSGVERERYAVNHGAGEYVRAVDMADGMQRKVTTNCQESAWSMLKRSISGVYHKMSPKHLRRYVKAFAGRWNIRELDTEEQMMFVFRSMFGKTLTYDDLTADNGLPSGSGPNGAYYPERRRRYQRQG